MSSTGLSRHAKGTLVAGILRGSWRPAPPAIELTTSGLNLAAPLLVRLNAAPLAWRKLRGSGIAGTPAAELLRDAYRMESLQAVLRVRQVLQVFEVLRSAGVEPVLVKGWAAALGYPEPALRPWGDIDLCVPPGSRGAAEAALLNRDGSPTVDLDHREVTDLAGLLSRSRLVTVEGAAVRVPGPEDHLRLSCIHALKHDVWRPLWLCDIAAAVEGRPADFDWPLLLGEDPRRAGWIAAAIALAHELLGLDLDGVPAAAVAADLPRWLSRAVLSVWGDPAAYRQPRERFRETLRHPRRVPAAVLARWPHPISASLALEVPLGSFPRLPFQMALFARRGAALLRRKSYS